MKKRKVVCICNAYKGSAHMVGAGLCTGEEWASSVFQNEGSKCQNCNCNTGESCEVADGAEGIAECEVYQKARNDNGFPEFFHPIPDGHWEKILKEELENYYF